MNTQTQLANNFLSLGWVECTPYRESAYRAFEGPALKGDPNGPCEPPKLIVEIYKLPSIEGWPHRGDYDCCCFKLCGQGPMGLWLKATLYSIPNDKVIESIPEVTRKAQALWDAWTKPFPTPLVGTINADEVTIVDNITGTVEM